jgi:hypothetical protein
MDGRELTTAIDEALAPMGSANDRGRIASALSDIIRSGRKEEHQSLKALDGRLSPEGGGYAFNWEDAFGLSVAVETALGFIGDLAPADAAAMLFCMVEFWRRLRRIRVPLSRDEFFVMKAVRNGCTTRNSIAAMTGLGVEAVDRSTSSLKSRVYREDTVLLEGEEGSLVTSF